MARVRANGEGTIGQRGDGRWVARYHVFTPSGQKPRSTYGKSRSEMAAKLARTIADREQKGPVDFDAERLTVAEYLNIWLSSKKPELASATYRKYKGVVENRLAPAFSTIRVVTLGPGNVEAYEVGLLDEGLKPPASSATRSTRTCSRT